MVGRHFFASRYRLSSAITLTLFVGFKILRRFFLINFIDYENYCS
jgi:hypothetical protein